MAKTVADPIRKQDAPPAGDFEDVKFLNAQVQTIQLAINAKNRKATYSALQRMRLYCREWSEALLASMKE